jgi:FlaA1/EpsC-like NDP-sugar epimerase
MSSENLIRRLDHLLSEPLDSVRQRQSDTLDHLLGGLHSPFILFGAGNLGRKALAVLQDMGLQPLAFIDNNPALWGSQGGQVPVFSPAQLAEQWNGPLPGVIATIW